MKCSCSSQRAWADRLGRVLHRDPRSRIRRGDIPLNSIPPTTIRKNLAAKRESARGQCWVDVAFWGGLVPGNRGELKRMVDDGVKGFKGFLIESGVEVRA